MADRIVKSEADDYGLEMTCYSRRIDKYEVSVKYDEHCLGTELTIQGLLAAGVHPYIDFFEDSEDGELSLTITRADLVPVLIRALEKLYDMQQRFEIKT